MMELTSTKPLTGTSRMNYETPPEGITLTGYILRRMHKTILLQGIEENVETDPVQALTQFGIYALASGTSFGPAMYQPQFDKPGTELTAPDPETGTEVTVRQLPRNPHYVFSYEVVLPKGSKITGRESITGTTLGFRGLGMPAPSQFKFSNVNSTYEVQANGVIHSELAPGFGRWRVRGYGELELTDNLGNNGHLTLNRKGHVKGEVFRKDETKERIEYRIA